MSGDFIHLHTHSQFSLLDATLSLPQITERASSFGMGAAALTDHGNLYGAIDFYKQCKEAKIKAIIGCELYLAPTSRFEKKKSGHAPVAFHLTLLAKNKIGYHNLIRLSSLGFTEGFYYSPRIDFDLLREHHEGLICLSGCLKSPIAHAIIEGRDWQALLEQYHSLFGEDFYLEIERHKMAKEDIELDGLRDETWLYHQYEDYIAKQEKVNQTLIDAASDFKIKLVATNDCHYLDRQDWRAHEIFINIQSGEPCELVQEDIRGGRPIRIPNPKRTTFESHELYFKSPAEMKALFADLPEALSSTCEIAEKCDLKLDFSTKHYPVFHEPGLPQKLEGQARKKSVADFLEKLCQEALPRRYTKDKLEKVQEKYPDQNPLDVVRARLASEMSVIVSKDMCDYLLIVWDFIHWAKNQGIPMGPGRGSGAGSIICYLIGITDIEPLRFNLFFERFINPERVSYPDIDVDICMERRQEVINYTLGKYGRDNVAQIITFGSMKAKMVIRDVGRTLSVPLAKVNTIAKLVPEELNITIEEALRKDAELKNLYDTDPDAKKIIDIGKKLEGSIRSTGLHAAGLIISEKPLIENIPICTAKDSDMLATQYSMKPVELVGMLKIDFLGLKTLTSIQICQDSLRAKGIDIDWTALPLDDPRTFHLLNGGKTQGVFQIETGGMQELAKNLHLDKFEEVIAVVALYRPGPMDMIPSYVARKHHREPIEYDHPWMEEILAETYGIMVYQEQVMQLASRLANYSLGEGDVLRRAMGKKDSKEMARQREKFTHGCAKNNISGETAGHIFDKMEKFAEYGFNKSHAAAYGYITYVTAYFKAHYPSEWLAALMTSDRDDITKIARLTHEGRGMHIPILPPHINESFTHFRATSGGIRFALSGIKGVGAGVVEAIINERSKNGLYKSLYNFVRRIGAKKVGKKTTELLIDAGCFDFTGWHRDAAKASLDQMFDVAGQSERDESAGVMSLFAELRDDEALFEKQPALAKLSSKEELLFREKALLGFFLSGHPLDYYKELMTRAGCQPLSALEKAPEAYPFRVAFVIDEVIPRIATKSQRKFVVLNISDASESQYELPIWPELYEEAHNFLIENRLILAILSKEQRNGVEQISCRWLHDARLMDETTLKACDAAYDKAKFMLTRSQNFSRNPKPQTDVKKQETIEVAKAEKHLSLSFDLEKLRASHILLIKEILSGASGGEHLVEIHFSSNDAEQAQLALGIPQKVFYTQALADRLTAIPSLISITAG
jgi:DNA polymerase-3 subunit alpha